MPVRGCTTWVFRHAACRSGLAVVLFLACLLPGSLLSCGAPAGKETEAPWTGTVSMEGGVEVVRNPPVPRFGRRTLELAEDLVLGDTIDDESSFFYRISAAVDGSGDIHIWDPNSYCIREFDKDGRFVHRVGMRGEGPGEFSDGFGMTFQVTEAGGLYVNDSGRLQRFDEKGNYLDAFPAAVQAGAFAVLAGGWVLNTEYAFERGGMFEQVVARDPQGTVSEPLGRFRSLKGEAAWLGGARFTLDFPELLLAPLSDEVAAFAYPSDYRIHLVGGEGREVRTIVVEAEATRMTGTERESILKEASGSVAGMSLAELSKVTAFPDTWPFFDGLMADERGDLYVHRREATPTLAGGSLLDVFDPQGTFVMELLVPVDQIQAIREGLLYARRFDASKNVSQLVRYRILNWPGELD